MSYGYPSGCTQATHDRGFGESLGEPPTDDVVQLDCKHWGTEDAAYRIGDRLLCHECEEALQKQLRAGELITKKDALTLMRVFVRIEQQIERASCEKRWKDAAEMSRIFGVLSWKAFEKSICVELGA